MNYQLRVALRATVLYIRNAQCSITVNTFIHVAKILRTVIVWAVKINGKILTLKWEEDFLTGILKSLCSTHSPCCF